MGLQSLLLNSVCCSVAPLANREFHEQYNPPPTGAATGFNGQEQVFPTKDAANDMEQLQHRITQFQDSYPRIEKFYSEYSKVVVVDETTPSDHLLNEEELFHEFTRAIEGHLDEEQNKIRRAEEQRQREENERRAKEHEEQLAKQKAEEEAERAREVAAQVSSLFR